MVTHESKQQLALKELECNEVDILRHHGNGDYDQALILLEKNQRIVKTNFGT